MPTLRNTIVIFTSNVGSSSILHLGSGDDSDRAEMRKLVTSAMRDHFKPEFLNRIDETVIFESLNKSNLKGIVKLEMERVGTRLKDKGIELVTSEKALEYIADIGYDGVYGARPLKRVIQREVERDVARLLLSGDVEEGHTISIDIAKETDRIAISVVKNKKKVKGEEDLVEVEV